MEVIDDLVAIDWSEYFDISCPLVRFSLYSVGSFIVKTFIIAFEDTAMPEAEVSSHPWSHFLLILIFVF